MSENARILMCPPDYYGIEYEINPWMNRRVGSDPAESLRQWTILAETLRGLGATIELLTPKEGLPDLVFTANAGLVFGDLFLASRFRHAVRQGETPVFEGWFNEHGFNVDELPDPYLFEGAGTPSFAARPCSRDIAFEAPRRVINGSAHDWGSRFCRWSWSILGSIISTHAFVP